MGESFRVELSSEEILIIAAMLGYESIFGVEDDVFSIAGFDMQSLVRRYVCQLERKKLLQYDLDGILYIVPELRQSIACLCNADTVGVFSTNLKSGKKTSVYIMEKEGRVASLEHFSDENYVIRLTDTIPPEEIIPREMLSSQHCEISEMMLFEEAEYVHRQIEAFNRGGAEACVQKHVKNDNTAKLIVKILTGNCGYMSVQIYRKGAVLYDAVCNTLLVSIDNCTVSLSVDENNVLLFEALSGTAVAERIGSQFKFGEKRGAV